MRILIFNWKDIRHAQAGGAEIVTHELAKNLVRFGHEVTIITSGTSILPGTESIDGVKIIRRGRLWSVHIVAMFLYLRYFRKNTDVVIDQIHGIPFFTPLYAKRPILAWIHEVAGEIWFKEFHWLAAACGLILESIYFALYKNVPFMTHTASTKLELEKKGVPGKHIYILPHTIYHPPKVKKISKAKYPTLIYLGRLSPMKRLELLLETTYLLKSAYPNLRLLIAGQGKTAYEEKLKRLASALNLKKSVSFLGYVSDDLKYKLLATSWLHIQPSVKEGFGLTVLEAASQATPTLCFNVPGLRNVVINNLNGLIVSHQSPQALARIISQLINNPTKWKKLSQTTYGWFKTLPTWKQQTIKFEKLLYKVSRNAL